MASSGGTPLQVHFEPAQRGPIAMKFDPNEAFLTVRYVSCLCDLGKSQSRVMGHTTWSHRIITIFC